MFAVYALMWGLLEPWVRKVWRATFRKSMASSSARSAPSPELAGAFACTYIGGAGAPLTPGAAYGFVVLPGILRWVTEDGQEVWRVPFGSVLEATPSGIGAYKSGGGFIGGGSGPEGAAEGIAAAAVLNALTTRTRVESLLRIVVADAEAVFAFAKALPTQIDLELASLRVFQRQRPHAPVATTPSSPVDVVDALARLADLYHKGVLDEDEFAAQKARLLAH